MSEKSFAYLNNSLISILSKAEVKKLSNTKIQEEKRFHHCINLLKDPKYTRVLTAEDLDEHHYWIATLYTLLMPKTERKHKAAYFTPPFLCKYLLAAVEEAGADFKVARVLDPAAGGAAFLSSTAMKMKSLGRAPKDIVLNIHGKEIDAGLAQLAEFLVRQRLGISKSKKFVQVCNSLDKKPNPIYDVVLANPPYGRILKPDKRLLKRFSDVIDPTHVNLYVLFIFLAFKYLRPGGIAGLIVPLSFIGGPAFAKLRRWLAENCLIKRIDVIESRTGVFLGVKQDTCVIILENSQVNIASAKPLSAIIDSEGKRKELGKIQFINEDPSLPWLLPLQGNIHEGRSTLSDYGYETRTGYFVWNREKDRYKSNGKGSICSKKYKFPLIWAKDIKQNQFIRPKSRVGSGVDLVYFPNENKSTAIIRRPCLVMQRTTSSKQLRRLVTGKVSGSLVKRWGGVITENHTIVIIPQKNAIISIDQMCQLLGSKYVDQEYRRMSGAVNISTKALRNLRLPDHKKLSNFLRQGFDFDSSVRMAYEE